jgi:hypothetical protein
MVQPATSPCQYAFGKTGNMRQFRTVCVPHGKPVYDHVLIDAKVLRLLWASAQESGVAGHVKALGRVEPHVLHALRATEGSPS